MPESAPVPIPQPAPLRGRGYAAAADPSTWVVCTRPASEALPVMRSKTRAATRPAIPARSACSRASILKNTRRKLGGLILSKLTLAT